VPITEDGAHLNDLWRRAQSFKAPEAPEEVTQELVVEIMRAGPAWWWSSHASLNYAMDEKLPRLTQRVLLLLPAKDQLSALAKRAIPLLSNPSVREFPDFGSGVMQQHADAIAGELRAFFDR
jgi:pimeloyl-ACP methyl ester carboxylesterase